jgi:hypothetical protein
MRKNGLMIRDWWQSGFPAARTLTIDAELIARDPWDWLGCGRDGRDGQNARKWLWHNG